MPDAPSLFVSDRPLGEAPAFNFPPIIQTLRDFISSAPVDAPLNICVSGGWGTGKTTLLRGLEATFKSDSTSSAPQPSHTQYVTIWFDPWKLASEEEVRNALAREVLEVIENDGSFSTRAEIGIERRNVLRMLSDRLLHVSPDDVSTLYKADSRMRETFVEVEDIFRRVADVYLRDPDQPRRLVIFVDDLDRCRPRRVTEVLESIKLFFDLPGLIFLFALDDHQLVKAVAADYKMEEDEAREYLEKIFQLTVPLPRKGTADLRAFLDSNLKEVGVELQNENLSSAIVERFGRNLRNLKLFINWFSFHRRLIGDVESIDEEVLFRWLYLDSSMNRSMTFALKGGSPNLVIALEFLAHGGFLHDSELRARYLRRLATSAQNYVALIAYAIVTRHNEDIELPATGLDVTQQSMIEALHSDGEITPTLRVMREGNKLLLDTDLRTMIGQTRSESFDIALDETNPGDRDAEPDTAQLNQGSIISAQEWNRLGDKLLSAQRLVDAYLCYLVATLIEPDEPAYICDVARIFSRTGQLPAAQQLLARGFERGPNSAYALVEAAHFYDVIRKEEEIGSLLYRKAIVNGNRSSTAPYYLAMNLAKKKNFRQAYLACLEACVMDPETETKRTLLNEFAREAGLSENAIPRSPEEFEAELASAKSAGEYPLALTDEEDRAMQVFVTTSVDEQAAASQLSRPPF